jgi:hypothetical protein
MFGLIGGFIGSSFLNTNVIAKSDHEKVLRAESFELVDKTGKVRGVMDSSTDTTILYLFDKNGKGGASIQVNENDSKLLLINNNNESLVDLYLDRKDSNSGLALYPDKKSVATDTLDKNSNKIIKRNILAPVIHLSSIANQKTGQVLLFGTDRKPSVILDSKDSKGSGSLLLFKENKLLWNAPKPIK